MLGGKCSKCCGKCGCKPPAKLPYTMTITFEGLKDKTHGNYCDLSITSEIGGGAAGVATAPGGCDNADQQCGKFEPNGSGGCKVNKTYEPSNRGPLTGVLLTNPGAGYVTHRSPPTLAVSGVAGSGAEFQVSLNKSKCQWSIKSISVSGGEGYVDDESLIIATDPLDTVVTEAAAVIHTAKAQPTLNATAQGGTGAVLSVAIEEQYDFWAVSSVSVMNGGSGYQHGSNVSFSLGKGDVSLYEAWATISNVLEDDGNGSFNDTGVIESIDVLDGGAYFKDTGVPTKASVIDSGLYYKDDPSGEPCSSIEVSPCGDGYGAKISATVDTNKSSGTYGQITGLTIDKGGQDYLAWRWITTCREKLNGVPCVLKAANPEPLITLSFESCYGSGAEASVATTGERKAPKITLLGKGRCGTITPSLSAVTDNDAPCGQQYWTIGSVDASGGWGYENGETASINYNGAAVIESAEVTLKATAPSNPPKPGKDGELTGATVSAGGKFYRQDSWNGTPGPLRGVTLDKAGSGYAKIGREEPHLKISSDLYGHDATFTPTFSKHQDSCGVDYWMVESVSVTGGSCYGVAGRGYPSLSVSATGGTGASLSFATEYAIDSCGGGYWRVASITASGGSGYTNGSAVTITASDGTVVRTAAAATLQVNDNGVPTGVNLTNGGAYFVRGADETLQVLPATANDKEEEKAELTVQANNDGVPTGVTVVKKGAYYRENKSLPPYVANVSVIINQALPSNGNGAEITATVGANPNNAATFGKITKLSLDKCGSDYQPLGGPSDCRYVGPCSLALQFNGLGKQAELTIDDAVFRTNSALTDCNNIPASASKFHSIGEGTASISPGGTWNPEATLACCGGVNVSCMTCEEPPKKCSSGTISSDETRCFPCGGECDPCNPCKDGCGCKNGKCIPCCDPCDENNPCPDGCQCLDGQCRPSCSAYPCPPDKPCCEDGECKAGRGGFVGTINWVSLTTGLPIGECGNRPFELVGPNGTCVLPFDNPCSFTSLGRFDTANECEAAVIAAIEKAQSEGETCFPQNPGCGFFSCGGNPLP